MALTNCHECGREVAQTADTCPNCGVKHPASKAASTMDTIGEGCQSLGCILTLAVTIPIVILAFCAL